MPTDPPPSYEECVKGYSVTDIPDVVTLGQVSPEDVTSPHPNQRTLPVCGNVTLSSYPIQVDDVSGPHPGHAPSYPVHLSEYAGSAPVDHEITTEYAGHYDSNMPSDSTSMAVTIEPEDTVIAFEESPIRMQCLHCNKEILTETEHVTGSTSWFWCLFLTLFPGCLLGCCLIPFFMPSCLDVEHTCPECGETLGTYLRPSSVGTGRSRAGSGSRNRFGRMHNRIHSRLRHRNFHHNSHLQNIRKRQRQRRQRRQKRRRRRRRRR